MHKPFIYLVKFFPKYFITFDAITDGTVFFVSILDYLLLIYRNSTDLYVYFVSCNLDGSVTSNSFWCGVFMVFYIEDHVICGQR